MKLLFCDKCFDIIKLGKELKSCECGHVKGKYIDYVNAEVNGNGFSLAIGNGSLVQALHQVQSIKKDLDRDNYIEHCKVEYCWVRPHEGPGNPHTKINKDL